MCPRGTGWDDHAICIYLWPVFVAPVGAACGDERAGGNDTRMPMDHAEEIRELTERVRGYERSYRIDAQSQISDYEYDQLVSRLRELERQFPELSLPDSPTRMVGDDRTSGFRKVTHKVPMLSLENTYSLEDLEAFDRRVRDALGAEPEYVCELKFDGVAISVLYRKGELVQAVTRGNGLEGDDVTDNVRTIASIPHRLTGLYVPDEIEFRGEIFMPRATFAELNAQRELQGQSPLANPRNAAAGSLKLHDHQEVAKRRLDCWLYYVVHTPPLYPTHAASMSMAQGWGIPVSSMTRICHSVAEVFEQITRWEGARDTLPFDTDGVVIKVNSYQAQQTLGLTSNSPRWAIAYKYPTKQAKTKLLRVDFQVGRTGVVVPVAILERVPLGGVRVQRATLHNADQVARLGLCEGDTVVLERGGEVIPKVVGVVPELRVPNAAPVVYPTTCPVCHTPLQRNEGQVHSYCPNNLECPAQIVASLEHYASRKAMDIEGLGGRTAKLLYGHGLVHHVVDLYSLTPEALQTLPRFSELVASKLLRSIEASKQAPLSRVLFGLGIRFVGANLARELALHFGDIDALMRATYEELNAIPEVGHNVAQSLVDFFAQESTQALVARFKELGFTLREESQATSDRLAGKKIVVSGKIEGYSREQIQQLIRSHGGVVQSSPSGETSYIVAGERMGASKRKAAERLGIPIITPSEFFGTLNQ